MSFFAACPVTGGLSVPRKSGHTRNADLTIVCHGARCPDLSGSAGALRIWHAAKKDIPMLFHTVLRRNVNFLSIIHILLFAKGKVLTPLRDGFPLDPYIPLLYTSVASGVSH